MQPSSQNLNVINVRITHKKAHIPVLEAASFKDKKTAYTQICAFDGVQEAVLIQTCNRIELYLVTENLEKTTQAATQYLTKQAAAQIDQAAKAIECSTKQDALDHLLKVTSGLESMVIGEEQIINQVWDAYLEAEKANTTGPVLKLLFNRAVNVGRRVRRETSISKGAISVGSAAVELAEKLVGKLDDKKILIMGAGENATLVAKAMARRCLKPVFIANRTFERAARLAEELGGQAIRLDRMGEVLKETDVVFCSTSAPHYLLTKAQVAQYLSGRQNKNALIIIDVSNPRNAEETIKELPQVKLYNIDDLTLITEQNKQERQKSVQEATQIISEELVGLECALKAHSMDELIAELLTQTEETRQRELIKALNMMGDLDERGKKIVNDLTCILMKQMFLPVIEKLRKAAVKDDSELIEVAMKLFEVKN
jgi:glutamyl-tRNA reductase